MKNFGIYATIVIKKHNALVLFLLKIIKSFVTCFYSVQDLFVHPFKNRALFLSLFIMQTDSTEGGIVIWQ